MAKTKRKGRPPKDDPRNHAVSVRLTASEYKKLVKLAKRTPLSVYIREVVLG